MSTIFRDARDEKAWIAFLSAVVASGEFLNPSNQTKRADEMLAEFQKRRKQSTREIIEQNYDEAVFSWLDEPRTIKTIMYETGLDLYLVTKSIDRLVDAGRIRADGNLWERVPTP